MLGRIVGHTVLDTIDRAVGNDLGDRVLEVARRAATVKVRSIIRDRIERDVSVPVVLNGLEDLAVRTPELELELTGFELGTLQDLGRLERGLGPLDRVGVVEGRSRLVLGGVRVLDLGHLERLGGLVALDGHRGGHVLGVLPTGAQVGRLVDCVLVRAGLLVGDLAERAGAGAVDCQLGGLGHGCSVLSRELEGELLLGAVLLGTVDGLGYLDLRRRGRGMGVVEERGRTVLDGIRVLDLGLQLAVAAIDNLHRRGHVARLEPATGVVAGLTDGVRERLAGIGERILDRSELSRLPRCSRRA